MPGQFRDFARAASSPGLVLIPQSLPAAAAIGCLLLFCEVCDASDPADRICLVPSLATYRP